MKYILALFILGSSPALASSPISELGNDLKGNINQFESKLECREWDANYLHVTVGASVAFDIPEIFEVQVVPQFTLIWTKEN